jgi:hypothetical protein
VRYEEKPAHWAWYALPIGVMLLAVGVILGWLLMWCLQPVGL